MKTINEQTEMSFTFEFKNRSGQLVAPAGAITYYVLDMDTSTKVVPDTSLPGGSSSIEVIISANDNRCISEGSKSEERLLVIKVDGFAKDSKSWVVERIGL